MLEMRARDVVRKACQVNADAKKFPRSNSSQQACGFRGEDMALPLSLGSSLRHSSEHILLEIHSKPRGILHKKHLSPVPKGKDKTAKDGKGRSIRHDKRLKLR